MRRLTYPAVSVLLLGVWHSVVAQPILAKTKIETKVASKPIAFDVKYVFNRDMGRGRLKKVTDGKPGELRTITNRVLIDGKLVKETKRTETVAAQPAIYHMGPSGFTSASRGSYTRAKVMKMEATAYTPDAGRGRFATFRTATGRRAAYGVVAVDPRVIPLNTLVFVEGYGFALACDTGGAIKGHRIDVCVADNTTARNWGRRQVTVHVFQGRHTKDSARK